MDVIRDYISEDGMVNVAVSLMDYTRHDIEQGYIAIMEMFGRIPKTSKEAYKEYDLTYVKTKDKYGIGSPMLRRLVYYRNKIKHFYDSLDFLKKDPYGLFEHYDDEYVVETVMKNAKENYEIYLERKKR